MNRRLDRLVLSCLLAGVAVAVVVAPRPAAACAMVRMPILRVQPARADELLAQANGAVDKADWATATRLADRVATTPGPRSDQRAQAFAIVGLAAWQRGAKARAMNAFKSAKLLDAKGASIDDVLARVKEPATVAAVRAALQA